MSELHQIRKLRKKVKKLKDKYKKLATLSSQSHVRIGALEARLDLHVGQHR